MTTQPPGVAFMPGAPRPRKPIAAAIKRAERSRDRRLVKLIREAPVYIDRETSKPLEVSACPKLTKDIIWQLSKEADSKMDRTSAILVSESVGHYQSAVASIVRARRVVVRHNCDPDARLWFSRLRFDAPRLTGVEAGRHAFRAPADLVDRVSGLAYDFGWEHRGPLILLCMLRTIVTYRYGHDLRAYQAWLDEFEGLIAQREEQALRLVRETHARLVSKCSYRRGMLDEFITEHPELEAEE